MNARWLGLAYRMLGSVQAAEDVVQEASLRLATAAGVRDPEAWGRTVVTRLCLDELRSARARRESVSWTVLPEPWVSCTLEDDVVRQGDIGLGLLWVLQRLSPLERAAWLLREVFDHDYEEVAAMLERTAPACRQLVARARRHLQDAPRYDVDPERHATLLARFGAACLAGDVEGLAELLHDDVVAASDGGGRIPAARKPLVGRAVVSRAYVGFARGAGHVRGLMVNGRPGAAVLDEAGLHTVLTIDERGGQIARVWSMRDPAKLPRAAALLGVPLSHG